MSSTGSHDTGLCGFQSLRLGALPASTEAVYLDGITLGYKGATKASPKELLEKLLAPWLAQLPESITDLSYMKKAENYSDTWLVFFSPKNHNGIWITHGEVAAYRGVWSLTGGEYSWAEVQRLDLVATVENGKLELAALK